MLFFNNQSLLVSILRIWVCYIRYFCYAMCLPFLFCDALKDVTVVSVAEWAEMREPTRGFLQQCYRWGRLNEHTGLLHEGSYEHIQQS